MLIQWANQSPATQQDDRGKSLSDWLLMLEMTANDYDWTMPLYVLECIPYADGNFYMEK